MKNGQEKKREENIIRKKTRFVSPIRSLRICRLQSNIVKSLLNSKLRLCIDVCVQLYVIAIEISIFGLFAINQLSPTF